MRQYFTFTTRQFVIYSLLNGIGMVALWPVQITLRDHYGYPVALCRSIALIHSFMQKYGITLLPLLAIERYVMIVKPLLHSQRLKRMAIWLTAGLAIIDGILTMTPAILINQLEQLGHIFTTDSTNTFNTSQTVTLNTSHTVTLKPAYTASTRRTQDFFSFHCHSESSTEISEVSVDPFIDILLTCVCIVASTVVYIRIYCIARTRMQR